MPYRRTITSVLLVLLVLSLAWLVWRGVAPPTIAAIDGERSENAPAAVATGRSGAVPDGAPQPTRTVAVLPDSGDVTPGSLRVRVVSEAGDPLAHMIVSVVAYDGRPARASQAQAATDGRGEVVFSALAPGTWQVTIERLADVVTQVDAGAETVVPLTVPGGTRAVVRVLDRSGQRVPGAAVTLWLANGILDIPQRRAGTVVGDTDAQGELALAGLPHLAGHGCWVAARHPRQGASVAQMIAAPQGEHDQRVRTIVLTLDAAGGSLEVHVADPSGALVDADVQVRPLGAPSSSAEGELRRTEYVTRRGVTRNHRPAVLAPLAPGTYALRAHHAGFAAHRQEVTLRDERTEVVTVTLADAARLIGSVRDVRGEPIAGAVVELRTQGDRLDATTSADGRLRVDDLAADQVDWRARHPDYASRRGTVTTVAGEAVALDVTLDDLAGITGTVRDQGGAPLAGWRVLLGGEMPGWGTDRRRGETAADGGFEIGVRAELAYQVRLLEPGRLQPILLPQYRAARAGGPPLEITVGPEHRATAFLTGTLLDSRRAPALQGTGLSLVGHGAHWFPGSTMPAVERDDAEGRFRLGPLLPGVYELWFQRSDRFEFHLDGVRLTANSTHDLGNVTWPAAGTLVVKVQLLPGIALGDILAELSGAGGGQMVRIDAATGTGTLSLRPGRYGITVFGDGFRSVDGEVVVVADETVAFDAVLQPAARVPFRVFMPADEDGVTVDLRGPAGEVVFDFELEPGQLHDDWAPQLTRGRHRLEAVGTSGRHYAVEFAVDSLTGTTERRQLRLVPVR